MEDADTIIEAEKPDEHREEANGDRKGFSLKDGLSIDEAKVSALILCTFCDFALVAFCLVSRGDITDNHLFLTQTLVAAVAGVNIAGQLASFIKRKG